MDLVVYMERHYYFLLNLAQSALNVMEQGMDGWTDEHREVNNRTDA